MPLSYTFKPLWNTNWSLRSNNWSLRSGAFAWVALANINWMCSLGTFWVYQCFWVSPLPIHWFPCPGLRSATSCSTIGRPRGRPMQRISHEFWIYACFLLQLQSTLKKYWSRGTILWWLFFILDHCGCSHLLHLGVPNYVERTSDGHYWHIHETFCSSRRQFCLHGSRWQTFLIFLFLGYAATWFQLCCWANWRRQSFSKWRHWDL